MLYEVITISDYPERFRVEALSAGSNIRLLIEQARRFSPSVVSIADKRHYSELKEALKNLPVTVMCGHVRMERL